MTKAFLAMMPNAEIIEENIDNIDVIIFLEIYDKPLNEKLKHKWQTFKTLFAIYIHNGLLFLLYNEFLQTNKKILKQSTEKCKKVMDGHFIEKTLKHWKKYLFSFIIRELQWYIIFICLADMKMKFDTIL